MDRTARTTEADVFIRRTPMARFRTCWLRLVAAVLPLLLAAVTQPAHAQQVFSSPAAAADALVDAIAASDPDALKRVLGADWKRFIPTADVDQDDVYAFLAAAAKSKKLVAQRADTAHLAVGAEGWTLPIPIVKRGDGWRFDTRAGAEEIRARRIGANELAAMQAALAYYDAQKEYATADRNGDGVLEYAQRIVSTPGRKDGLYWAALPGEPESPLGPVFGDERPGDGYHGYRFRILKAQGKSAPGGAYDYVIGGRMRAGFALVAWPARYGDTGVMSFVVSHSGQLYEKDLGPNTDAIARAMTRFDPDSTWQRVTP
jgi:hypothetical protein